MPKPPSPAVRRGRGAVAAALFLALSTSACSGSSDSSVTPPGDGGSSASGATDSPGTPALETTATLGKVEGKLPKAKRSKVRQQVAHAVDQWFDAAYVGGTYPRDDFSSSWPDFTTGAKADAEGDKRLMSNEAIGSQISAVEATVRKVSVDVLAVKGHPQGATARFVLKFKTSGDVQRKIEISGRLFLTPGADGWQIFGYDVTKGRAA